MAEPLFSPLLQHLWIQTGHRPEGQPAVVLVQVQFQHCFQCQEGELVNAEGPEEGISFDNIHQILAAADNARLGSAEELVSAVGDYMAVFQRTGNQRLAKGREGTAADVFDEEQTPFPRELSQLLPGDALS